MLDVALFRNLRFSAASGAVTITFFSLMGFIFVITLYFQFLKGYGPLSTGVRLLPVAIFTGITAVLGTRLAVRSGTKLVVAGGMVTSRRVAPGFDLIDQHRLLSSRLDVCRRRTRADQRPATESIMGRYPRRGGRRRLCGQRRDEDHRCPRRCRSAASASIYNQLADLPAQVRRRSGQRTALRQHGLRHLGNSAQPAGRVCAGLHQNALNPSSTASRGPGGVCHHARRRGRGSDPDPDQPPEPRA
jgi:hypothetical protein